MVSHLQLQLLGVGGDIRTFGEQPFAILVQVFHCWNLLRRVLVRIKLESTIHGIWLIVAIAYDERNQRDGVP
jgi:hypothetical protein